MKILQWNVWFKEDVRNIAHFLQEHPADVICLQELTLNYQKEEPDTIAYIAKKLGYNYHFKEITHEDETWQQANAIFTKYPIITKGSHWINKPVATEESSGPHSFDNEYRAYVEVMIDADGHEFTFGTTHMSYTHRFKDTLRKAQETQKLIDILKTKKQNFVFTGDLNATPDSPTVKAISKVLQNAGPNLHGNTWTTKAFSYNDFSEEKLH